MLYLKLCLGVSADIFYINVLLQEPETLLNFVWFCFVNYLTYIYLQGMIINSYMEELVLSISRSFISWLCYGS